MTTYSKRGKRLGRPPGKTKPEFAPGSKEKTVKSLTRFAENPTVPMIAPHLAAKLAATRAMGIAPTALFADDGHNANAVQWLARKAQVSKPGATPEECFDAFEAFMTWSTDNRIPPTLGAWSVWNGVTLQRLSQIERETSDDARSRAFLVCKEILRTFMEQRTWDSALNPLLFFNAMKSQYGLVEKTEVTVLVEDNTSDLTADEYNERLVLLTQGEDGVYRE